VTIKSIKLHFRRVQIAKIGKVGLNEWSNYILFITAGNKSRKSTQKNGFKVSLFLIPRRLVQPLELHYALSIKRGKRLSPAK